MCHFLWERKSKYMKYYFVQNIIAPYRVSLFNSLKELGLDFEVLYMSEKEADRSWDINMKSLKYTFEVCSGFYKFLKGFHLHFNPSLIKKCISLKNGKIILGGSWNDLNVVSICLLKRVGLINCDLWFWAEANYLTIGAAKQNILRDKLRNFIYSCGNGTFIVPGKMSVETFKRWGVPVKRVIFLPNVIDESVFCISKTDYISKDSTERPQFVIPARLTESYKGILNFFKKIGSENVRKCKFYVLGDGPDEKLYASFVEENGYQESIRLEGFKTSRDVLRYYLQCNALILPSFSDPSPLSLPEGLSVGLPLLVSNRCGNYFETLENGVNGYLMDPFDENSVKGAFEKFLSARQHWESMGKESLRLFNKNFKQSVVLQHFYSQLKDA